MEYIIVPMDRGHIPQIAALERECFSTPWSENMLSDALFDPKASFIVAEDGEGGVLGYAGTRWCWTRATSTTSPWRRPPAVTGWGMPFWTCSAASGRPISPS